jgi:hypothetical protein
MRTSRLVIPLLLALAVCAAQARANWISFAGGPAVALGTWPAGSGLAGTATVTASNFINGNNATPLIGLTPINVGPPLSTDFFAAGLQPNLGGDVPMIGTPYNDRGDRYHVVIDFSGTTGGSNPGVLPAGTLFAIIDLDIAEDYRRIQATDAANLPITTPWFAGPNGYFDMTPPMIPQGSLVPNPTLTGPIAGTYEMFGVTYNFDVGMWLFQTTQDVKTISFDMSRSVPGNAIGGGGAGWAFYSPVPEPSTATLIGCGALAMCWGAIRRARKGTAQSREEADSTESL